MATEGVRSFGFMHGERILSARRRAWALEVDDLPTRQLGAVTVAAALRLPDGRWQPIALDGELTLYRQHERKFTPGDARAIRGRYARAREALAAARAEMRAGAR